MLCKCTIVTVDGGRNEWSSWSLCTATCGLGVQSRSRSCSSPRQSINGKYCEGHDGVTRTCNKRPCQGNIINVRSEHINGDIWTFVFIVRNKHLILTTFVQTVVQNLVISGSFIHISLKCTVFCNYVNKIPVSRFISHIIVCFLYFWFVV